MNNHRSHSQVTWIALWYVHPSHDGNRHMSWVKREVPINLLMTITQYCYVIQLLTIARVLRVSSH